MTVCLIPSRQFQGKRFSPNLSFVKNEDSAVLYHSLCIFFVVLLARLPVKSSVSQNKNLKNCEGLWQKAIDDVWCETNLTRRITWLSRNRENLNSWATTFAWRVWRSRLRTRICMPCISQDINIDLRFVLVVTGQLPSLQAVFPLSS